MLIGQVPGKEGESEPTFNDYTMAFRMATLAPTPLTMADGVAKLLFVLAAAGISFAIVKFTTPSGGSWEIDPKTGEPIENTGTSIAEGVGLEIGKGVNATLKEAMIPILLVLIALYIIKEQLD